MIDDLNNTERYETNLNKQVTKKIQKDGRIYKYNYDIAKRFINTIDSMNYRINLIYSLGDDILKTTDTLGRQVNYEYDVLHNLTKKIDVMVKMNFIHMIEAMLLKRLIDEKLLKTLSKFTKQ